MMMSANASNLSASNDLFPDYNFSLNLDHLYKFLRESDWNYRVVPLTVFVSILMVAGILGNCLVIAVFVCSSSALSTASSRMGGSRSKPLIVALAVADLLLCVIGMPGQIVRAWYLPWRWDAVCKAWELLRHTVLPISAAILVGIAYDRYRLICHPTRQCPYKVYKRRLAIMLGGSCFLGVAFGIPPMLGVGVYQVSEDGSEVIYIGLCEVNGLIISQDVLNIYWRVVVVFFWMVLVSLLVMYSAILLRVWRQAKLWNRRTRVYPLKSPANTANNADSNTTSRPPALIAKADSASKYCESEATENDRGRGVRTYTTEVPDSPHQDTDPNNPNENGLFFVKVADLSRFQPKASSVIFKRTETLEFVVEQPKRKSDSGVDTVLQSCSSTSSDTGNANPPTHHQKVSGQSSLQQSKRQQFQHNQQLSPHSHSGNTWKRQWTVTASQTRGHKDQQAAKQAQPGRPPCRAHVKTAMVFFLVTATFLLSYSPTFLMIVDLVPDHPVIFYTYFIHAAANPLLYSLTNKKFRTSAKHLFDCGP